MILAHYLLAYPELNPADAVFVDAFRTRHDAEKRALIRPHVTVVFPHPALGATESYAPVKLLAGQTPPIRGVLRRALPWREGDETLIYLLPEEGNSELIALHARLTSGALVADRSGEHTYLPHMTIGRTRSTEEADALCANLNRQGLGMPFVVDSLTLVSVEGGTATEILRFGLTG